MTIPTLRARDLLPSSLRCGPAALAVLLALSLAVVLLLGRLVVLELSSRDEQTQRLACESRLASVELLTQDKGRAEREAAERRKVMREGFRDMANTRLVGPRPRSLESPALPHAEAP